MLGSAKAQQRVVPRFVRLLDGLMETESERL
jgi:hypothetical protein